jgi:lipoprotein-releasing system permease protein
VYELLLAVRHLRARRKRSLSIVTWLAVGGVALGVTALVGGFSITSGFEQAFREKVLGVTAHVFVREYGTRFTRYRDVEAQIQAIEGVKATAPMTFNNAMVSGGAGTSGAIVKGIVPERAVKVLAIRDYIVDGSVEALSGRKMGLDGVLLGADLARKVGAKAGDVVTLVSPLKSMNPDKWRAQADVPTTRDFHVAGVFRAGFHEYDTRLLYMELSAAQGFFGAGDAVMGIEVAVDDPVRAGDVATRIDTTLGDDAFSVLDWRRQNKNLFASLTYQRLAILVVLSVMVVLASCNVACVLIMLVLERTRDIAILKAMGARNTSILSIFLAEGLAIGVMGTAIGMTVAYALCEGLLANGITLDAKVYGISNLPVVFAPLDYVMAAIGALTITLFASLFPAIRGARLHPVDGLREVVG